MITWRALAAFAVIVVSIPLWAGLGLPPWPILAVGLLLIVTLCVVDVALAPSTGQLRLWRTGDTVSLLGGTARVTLHVRNTGNTRLNGQIRDAWTPSAGAHAEEYVLRLPPGGTAELTTVLTPTRRGDRPAARVTVRSNGPLGFGFRQTPHRRARELTPQWNVRVLPPFHARRHLSEKLARLRVIEGAVAVRGRGQGTEFDAMREYVPGDDVRSIDWRASARSQSMIVKTWRVERDRRVLSVIDTGRTSAVRVGDEPRLDAQIEACLLLSAVASHAGDRVDAMAVDTDVRAAVDNRSGRTVLPRLMRALSPLEPALVETDYGMVVSEILRRESKRALVVLFTSLEPGAVTESLLPALPQLATRHQVLIATVSDPEVARLHRARSSLADVYSAAAAEQSMLERRKVAAALARHNVDVIEAPADAFASTVVDRYLLLKTTGRL